MSNKKTVHVMPTGHPALGMASLLGLLLLLGGCAVGPDFKKPAVTVNQSWSARNDPRIATQTAADSLWWRSFNDAGLDRLVDLAYQQNLPLQIAALKIMEARAQLGVATGSQYPHVRASAGGSATGLSRNAANV